ncbi:MAG TPA: glycoside hydrolase family 88 protein [Pyrinomonadaceae bacterium]|jgi:Glycosyl Hydrolase Family 88.|nr:glycoside hydrolase family 88 protein [Pyrinomonadaceae bacterium]
MSENLLTQVEHAFSFAQEQVSALVKRDPNFYPLYTDHGKWRHTKPAWTRWCDGFLPGMMWIFHQETGDPNWRTLAEKYSRPLEPRKDDREVHDLGFIFYHSTYKRWYEATVRDGSPDQSLKDVVVHAGQTLALRFNDVAGCLRSFHGPDSNFIDIMMNVGIIFYAALETNDTALLELAHKHCQTTRRTLVRGDGSTSHEGIFDLSTGEFLRQTTQQGYRGDSCWSRGLAWSLYGFGTCFQLTRDPTYLEVAQLNAEWWLAHIAQEGVAPWDFDAPLSGPLSRSQVDTSASAIAAVGLFNLAELSPSVARRKAYLDCALRTLDSLTNRYLGEGEDGWEGILRGGVYHIHKDLGVNESVMWGEFFFVEALQKARRLLSDKL